MGDGDDAMSVARPTPPIDPLLELRSVTKRFPGVLALDRVDLVLDSGSVVAVVGENGAGKSTLMKIIGGLYTADSGSLRIDGQEQRFGNAGESMACGISLIHQELNLVDNLTIAENVFLGREPRRWESLGWIDRGQMESRTEHCLERVGLRRSPRDSLRRLPLAERQLVEIAKALSLDARIVVMDEPTAPLTAADTEVLFAVIDDLRQQGIGILYVSHRLAEIQRLADSVIVLRDGRRVGSLERSGISEERLVELMIGGSLSAQDKRPTLAPEGSAVALRVRDLQLDARELGRK